MKKPIFRSKWVHNPIVGEVNNEPSLTVPDMALTIQEIFDKYVTFSEIGMEGESDPDDIDFDDPVLSNPIEDLTELEEFRSELVELVSSVKAKQAAAKSNTDNQVPDQSKSD